MAGRPPKEGIDYSPWDVNIFDNSPQIDKLIDGQGVAGFVIYFYLCQRAYGSKGYYTQWSYDDAATTARKIGGGVGSDTVIQTVNLCFHVGLFDRRLHEEHGIITGHGIQKRFWEIAKTRTCNTVNKDYWLLVDEAGSNNSNPKTNYEPPKLNYDTPKLNYDTIKERKAKERKRDRKQTKFVPPTLEEIITYCKERKSPVDPKRFFEYFDTSGWVDSKGNTVRNWKQKLLTWENHSMGNSPLTVDENDFVTQKGFDVPKLKTRQT